MIILAYISICAYAFFSGKKDGVLWSGMAYGAYPGKDIHQTIFTPERLSIGVACVSCLASNWSWLNLGILFASAFAFPFFHNGSYYIAREKIDGSYRGGWFDHSKDYKSAWNISPTVRTILFILPIVIIIIYEAIT